MSIEDIVKLIAEQINNLLQPLCVQIEKSIKDSKSLRDEINSLRNKIETVRESKYQDFFEERQIWRMYVILHWKKQFGSEEEHLKLDEEIIESAAEELNGDLEFSDVQRIGLTSSDRLRLLPFRSEKKTLPLMNAKTLRSTVNSSFQSVFIYPDLTLREKQQR